MDLLVSPSECRWTDLSARSAYKRSGGRQRGASEGRRTEGRAYLGRNDGILVAKLESKLVDERHLDRAENLAESKIVAERVDFAHEELEASIGLVAIGSHEEVGEHRRRGRPMSEHNGHGLRRGGGDLLEHLLLLLRHDGREGVLAGDAEERFV